ALRRHGGAIAPPGTGPAIRRVGRVAPGAADPAIRPPALCHNPAWSPSGAGTIRVIVVIHLLHTADWQVGRQYGQFETDDAAMLAEARYEAVARIAALAAQRQVDAVLVA